MDYFVFDAALLGKNIDRMVLLLERGDTVGFVRDHSEAALSDPAPSRIDSMAARISQRTGLLIECLNYAKTAERVREVGDGVLVIDISPLDHEIERLGFTMDPKTGDYLMMYQAPRWPAGEEPDCPVSRQASVLLDACADPEGDPAAIVETLLSTLSGKDVDLAVRSYDDLAALDKRLGELEARFLIRFPEDYRRFLARVGCLGFRDAGMICPIKGMERATLSDRDYICQSAFPGDEWIAIHEVVHAAVTFFDDPSTDGHEMCVFYPVAGKDEAEVRVWDEGEYRSYLGEETGWRTFVQPVGSTFSDFIRGFLHDVVASLEEDGVFD